MPFNYTRQTIRCGRWQDLNRR